MLLLLFASSSTQNLTTPAPITISTNDRIQGQMESEGHNTEEPPETPGYRYVVIERMTNFHLSQGRSSSAHAFTETTLRSAEPTIGQISMQQSEVRKFVYLDSANNRAKELSDRRTQTNNLPVWAHHEGLRADGTRWYVMVLHDGLAKHEVDVVRRWETPGQVHLG